MRADEFFTVGDQVQFVEGKAPYYCELRGLTGNGTYTVAETADMYVMVRSARSIPVHIVPQRLQLATGDTFLEAVQDAQEPE